jgi:hypothetical protein
VLPFDDEEFAGYSVADVLADPERFDGATLADLGYGRRKARIMRRPDGTPWIHSFAHGRTIYELKLDASAVQAAMEEADKNAVVSTLVELAVAADLDDQELEELRNLAAERTGTNKRTITTMLKAAQRKHAAEHAEQERKRRAAERSDPRPLIKIPANDAPWLPQVEVLDGVLGGSPVARPPSRDIDGVATRARKLPVPNTHAFTDSNTDQEE